MSTDPDTYLAINEIANDQFMTGRVTACATQQSHLGNIDLTVEGAMGWVVNNRYLWASSPGWGAQWKYASDLNQDDPAYEPGADAGCITDQQILATVQALLAPPGKS